VSEGASALRHVLSGLKDVDGFAFPLLREPTLTVLPPRGTTFWRAESDVIGKEVVGRGSAPHLALSDWQKRFANAVARVLELRPFEMSADDRELYTKAFRVIDLAAYRATKPYKVRQAGTVLKHTGHSARTSVVVRWEDGKVEPVKTTKFDEAIARYHVGQRFEVLAVRHPLTTKLLRAFALRKLDESSQPSDGLSDRLWEQATRSMSPQRVSGDLDAAFWGFTDE